MTLESPAHAGRADQRAGVIADAAARAGRYRWGICALLFAATAINYVDRQMIGVLKPIIAAEMQWTESGYANIVFWFQAAYAVGYLGFGRIVDRLGARFGYALAFLIWTLGHIAHGLARGSVGFASARALLGLGESGNFPGGIKAVTEWFPARERALAIGLFNAGANVGAILTPIIVPLITVTLGWRAAFLITGLASLIWLAAWLILYRTPRRSTRLSPEELAYIESDPPEPVATIPWSRLLRHRETWAYAVGKFLTDPVWWFYLFWLPDFLAKRYHLDLVHFGPPLVVVYVMSDVGSIVGGFSSSLLIRRGLSANRARKLTMLACALIVTPIFFAQYTDDLWLAVLIVGMATAAHQAWSANLYALPSDMFPRSSVGSVIGIGGAAGAVGGMLMAKLVGYVLDTTHNYKVIFAAAGCCYLVALLLIQLLTPRLAPIGRDG